MHPTDVTGRKPRDPTDVSVELLRRIEDPARRRKALLPSGPCLRHGCFQPCRGRGSPQSRVTEGTASHGCSSSTFGIRGPVPPNTPPRRLRRTRLQGDGSPVGRVLHDLPDPDAPLSVFSYRHQKSSPSRVVAKVDPKATAELDAHVKGSSDPDAAVRKQAAVGLATFLRGFRREAPAEGSVGNSLRWGLKPNRRPKHSGKQPRTPMLEVRNGTSADP